MRPSTLLHLFLLVSPLLASPIPGLETGEDNIVKLALASASRLLTPAEIEQLEGHLNANNDDTELNSNEKAEAFDLKMRTAARLMQSYQDSNLGNKLQQLRLRYPDVEPTKALLTKVKVNRKAVKVNPKTSLKKKAGLALAVPIVLGGAALGVTDLVKPELLHNNRTVSP